MIRKGRRPSLRSSERSSVAWSLGGKGWRQAMSELSKHQVNIAAW